MNTSSRPIDDLNPVESTNNHQLLNIHYLVSTILLSFYGVAVCPFIETLSIPQLVTPIVATFLLMIGFRLLLWQHVVVKAPLEDKTSTIFRLDLALFVGFGFLLAAYNSIIFDFPAESGIKIIIGMLSLGWFASVDIALQNENLLGSWLKQSGSHFQQREKFLPLTQKFTFFTIISLAIISITMLLVVRKDIDWIIHNSDKVDLHQAQFSILLEFLFVLVILIAYLFRIIKSYTQNTNFVLSNQNQTLKSVANGDFNVSVPITSNDEFGIMAQLTNTMIHDLHLQKEEIKKTRDITIFALSSLAETRDNETGAHILRTQYYVKALAEKLSEKEEYSLDLTEDMIDLLCKSAPLHDIGKVGIPDKILLKPGKLDIDEFEIMKTHAALGGQAIRNAEATMGETSFLCIAKEIAETHHEKWDGSGYPNALVGKEIPISGRLMALADVYDALISKRVYKDAFSHEKAKQIICEGKGKHFDPDIVDVFLQVESQFLKIAAQYKN